MKSKYMKLLANINASGIFDKKRTSHETEKKM